MDIGFELAAKWWAESRVVEAVFLEEKTNIPGQQTVSEQVFWNLLRKKGQAL